MNKFVVIGFLGDYTVYIDVTRDEAINRYNSENPDYTVESNNLDVQEIEIKDGKFRAYQIWRS